MYICDNCSKTYQQRQSLYRHKKKCHRRPTPYKEIPTFDGSEFGTGKPKSKETINKIERLVNREPTKKGVGVIESILGNVNPKPKDLEPVKLYPRIVESCDEDDDESDEEDDEEKIEQNLEKRFKKLFCEDKHRNRNELLYLLSTMLHHEFITPEEFQTVSNILFSEEEEKEEEKDDKRSLIRSTTNFVTKHDKDKLKKLIEKFKKIDDSEKLEELEKTIDDEKYYYDNEKYKESIVDYLRVLENTTEIPRIKLMKFKLILNNMVKDRRRVHSILQRLSDIQNEEIFAGNVRSLFREDLISEDTFNKLMQNDVVLELKAITNIIKTEVGSGLFLGPPRFV